MHPEGGYNILDFLELRHVVNERYTKGHRQSRTDLQLHLSAESERLAFALESIRWGTMRPTGYYGWNPGVPRKKSDIS